MCSLASFKAQAGMNDGPNGFLTFKLLSISNISLGVVYLKINLLLGRAALLQNWYCSFHQNIHLTLKIIVEKIGNIISIGQNRSKTVFESWYFCLFFSQFLISLIKFHLSLALIKLWNTSSRCFSFSCFETFLLLLFDVFANFFTVFLIFMIDVALV